MIYYAVVRPKCVYVLATAALTQALMPRVDASQLRGLRQILKLRRPCVERSNTNARVLDAPSRRRLPKGGRLKAVSRNATSRSGSFVLFGHVLRSLPEDLLCRVTFVPGCGTPLFRAQNWTIECSMQARQSVLGRMGLYALSGHDIEEAIIVGALEHRF